VKLFTISLRFYPANACLSFTSLLSLLFCADALAFRFGTDDGELTGSLDTTLSYGQMYRMESQDKNNDDINTNDGNRNFSKGKMVTNAGSITSIFKLSYDNYGLTLKGRGYYDHQIAKNRNDYFKNSMTPEPAQAAPYNSFPKETRKLSGRKVELLDAYVNAHWDWEWDRGDGKVLSLPFQLTVGKHVLNWGESMFYRGGVNSGINPLDLTTYRMMNYNLNDLKELYIPMEAVSFNLGLGDDLSVEAFYQWKWKETILPPVGTFFSETDLLADGANTAWADQASELFLPVRDIYPKAIQGSCSVILGLFDPCNNGLTGLAPGVDPTGIIRVAGINSKKKARDDGQFGLSFKYTAQALNNTEFGFYFVNYHSKEPVLVGDMGGYQGHSMLPLVLGQPFWNGQGFGNILDFIRNPLAAIQNWGINGGLLMAIDAGGSVRGWREYPEDIRMYGFSFATEWAGVSWAGEITYRPNVPIGIMTTNDLVADLLYQAPFAIDTNPITRLIHGGDGTAMVMGKPMTLEDTLYNYERVEMFNTSLSAIKFFGAGLSFDSSLLLFNIASEHYRGSSFKYTGYDTSVPVSLQKAGLVERRIAGRGNRSYFEGGTDKDQISRDAYGFTLSFEGTWNNVFGLTLKPFIVYQDAFKGNSHMTGNFIEGAKAYSIGMRAEMDNLEAEVQYTEFWGGGMNNMMRDRDNASFNVKYSF